jgi:arsenate reductase
LILRPDPNPAYQINLAAMAEVGIDIAASTPKLLDGDTAYAADVIISMGCGDACPVLPGKRLRTESSTTRQRCRPRRAQP